MAALRAEVWRRLVQRVEVMHAFCEAGGGEGSGEHLRDHWRELTPDIFVAASILTIVAGIQQQRPEPEVRKQLETIGQLQASVWVAICLTWGREPGQLAFFGDLDGLRRREAFVAHLAPLKRKDCRVGGDVTAPTPHRPGRADFPHPVLHERVSLALA